ncbi:MAG TPA: ferritin family protein, partial [Spirochaetales bacterium]|nr:ferritin family protein [Spirochaetales bacterium]
SLKNIAQMTEHSPIITDEIVKRIAESQYVTTALASAVLLEATALRFYADSAEKTIYPELQSFFSMLSEWERKHYNNLIAMQEQTERFWFDLQRFEPF